MKKMTASSYSIARLVETMKPIFPAEGVSKYTVFQFSSVKFPVAKADREGWCLLARIHVIDLELYKAIGLLQCFANWLSSRK